MLPLPSMLPKIFAFVEKELITALGWQLHLCGNKMDKPRIYFYLQKFHAMAASKKEFIFSLR